MKIGDIVKSGNNEEFEIVCVKASNLYPINTEKVRTGEEFTFTMKGKFRIDVKSNLDLQVDKDGNILTFGSRIYAVEDITEPTIAPGDKYILENMLVSEPVEEVVEEVVEPVEDGTIGEYVEPVEEEAVYTNERVSESFIAPPFKLEDIVYKGDNKLNFNTGDTINIGITPYEASLKATKLELLAELTGLVEDNRDIGEIILKVKKLKKLLEL